MDLKSYLNNFLNGQRLVILGIGSELCGDDSAGMLCAASLKKELLLFKDILVLAGSTAPENFSGAIRDFQPQRLLLIDAADLELPIGSIGIIDPKDIKGISFSTHMLPLSMLLQYIDLTCKCEIGVLGIQYRHKSYGDSVCIEVQQTVSNLVDTISKLAKAHYQ